MKLSPLFLKHCIAIGLQGLTRKHKHAALGYRLYLAAQAVNTVEANIASYEAILKEMPRDADGGAVAFKSPSEPDDTALNTAKELLRKQKEAFNTTSKVWRTHNENFGRAKHIRAWNRDVEKVKRSVLPQALSMFAAIEGVAKANEAMRFGLEMEDASIDMGPSIKIASKLFTIEFAALLLKRTKLSNYNSEAILNRIIAQEFPTKDNMPINKPSNADAKADRLLSELRTQIESSRARSNVTQKADTKNSNGPVHRPFSRQRKIEETSD